MVAAGSLVGDGTVAGSVTVTAGAFLSPGGGDALGVLNVGGSLSLAADTTCAISLDSELLQNDAVAANGVTINPDAVISFDDLGSATLSPGVTFHHHRQ